MNKDMFIALAKLWFGFLLFWMSGGYLLVVLGLIPAAAIVFIIGLLSLGTLSTAITSLLTTISILWVLVGLPMALRGVTWMEEGILYFTGLSFGIAKLARKGTEKIPIIKEIVGFSTMGILPPMMMLPAPTAPKTKENKLPMISDVWKEG